jgi:MFS transporter, AAHS family, 4-hydroxybenzoate transporter
MMAEPLIDISRLIDERRMNSFNAKLVILSFFVIFFDGYDISAVAFAGPYLVKEWHISSMAALGPVFSASLFGIFFGSAIFGWIGDRWGRKSAIIWSCVTFGVFTLGATQATSVTELFWLRFFAGVGIGGLPPTLIALIAEFSPKRARGTMVILMFSGITFGGAIPGFIAASLAPLYGWQILFWIGGILPLLAAIGVYLLFPESLKFLVLKTTRRADIEKTVRALEPGLAIGPSTRFTVTDERAYANFSPKLLFQDGRAAPTVILWVLFICNQMAFYFSNQWLPTALSSVGVGREFAAIATSFFQIGGTLGGLALMRPLDKMGFAPVSLLFFIALPVVGAIGFTTGSHVLLFCDVFLAGFCLLGLQFGLNVSSALIYPTSFRANGSGWAFSVGRAGSVAGPIIGGILLQAHVPLQQIFLLLLIPLGIGAILSLFMTRFYREQVHPTGAPQPAE